MHRPRSSNVSGGSFNLTTRSLVWSKATPVPGLNPGIFRNDICGKRIAFSQYGLQSDYGWEIDHIIPVSRGGSDDLVNLQPLHWRNNSGKSDHYPRWHCTVSF